MKRAGRKQTGGRSRRAGRRAGGSLSTQARAERKTLGWPAAAHYLAFCLPSFPCPLPSHIPSYTLPAAQCLVYTGILSSFPPASPPTSSVHLPLTYMPCMDYTLHPHRYLPQGNTSANSLCLKHSPLSWKIRGHVACVTWWACHVARLALLYLNTTGSCLYLLHLLPPLLSVSTRLTASPFTAT